MTEAPTPATPLALTSETAWQDRVSLARQALTFAAALALSVYLALSGGGYDIVVRSELGLVVWWFVLLAVIVGALPRAAIPRAGWVVAALLAGFLLWTWLGLAWTTSHQRTLDQVCRVSTYLGVLVIGLCAVRADNARALVGGLACGIAVVSLLAVLSKLTPSLFPADTASSFYATARLSYPFDYADGVGEYAALGIPLLLYLASDARRLLVRAGALALLEPVLLCLAMTVSRGGILAAALAVVALLALMPNRIPRLVTLALSGAGIAVLMVALLGRPALRDSITAAPAPQRHSMLVILLVVMVAVAALQLLLQAAMRRIARPRWLEVGRRGAQAVAAAIAGAVAVAVAVGAANGTLGRLFAQFKQWQPSHGASQYSRLLSIAGSHRYQYWQVAWKAFLSSPLHGIGPGTYRYYWLAHTTTAHAEFVKNAHSLWFETLAETGIVGWLLIAGFFAAVVTFGAHRALLGTGPERAVIAAATAAVVAFIGAASFDWVWQIGVVPMVTMLLAAAVFGAAQCSAAERPAARRQPWRRVAARAAFAVATVVAMAVIAVPLTSTVEVRASQAAARADKLSVALRDARDAAAVEPAAEAPYLQQAFVYEQADDIPDAAREISAAIKREPDNYTLWLIAERIQTELDHPRRALADYRHAQRLYPTSTVFIG